MEYQKKTSTNNLEKFQDRMYRHYLDEKQTYRETDVLSKKEYIKKYKDFLIDKLIEESKSEGQG